jgi:O-antigen/teichoic acid export membrane protein
MVLSDVGVYNVGYQIGKGMSLIASAGNNAIVPLFGNLDVSDEQDIEHVAEVFTYYMATVIALGLCIALFGEELIAIATPSEYHAAGNVVPWVVLGYLLMALYYAPTNLLTITEGQTHVVGIATVIGATMNVGLNILFIPIIGIYGAAVTTTATYLVMCVGVYLIAAKNYSIPFEKERLSFLFGAALLTFGVGWSVAPESIIWGITAKIGSLPVFPLALWGMGFFREKEKKVIHHYVGRIQS